MHGDLTAYMEAAIDEARAGLAEGGIPIGSVLVIDGAIVGRGHNRRVQNGLYFSSIFLGSRLYLVNINTFGYFDIDV